MKAPEVATTALEKLLEISQTHPGYDLEICVGYISASGVLNLRPLFDAARQRHVVAALSVINSVAAFQLLQDYGAEVYVYPPDGYAIFHPKIYLGTTRNSAWAMVGSSNLTQNGLLRNVEYNLFYEGQRHTDPFISVESHVQSFRNQAYQLDETLTTDLRKIEDAVSNSRSEREFSARLKVLGITPKHRVPLSIPSDTQQAAIQALTNFVQHTRLEYAYQMLLLLVILKHADEHGVAQVSAAVDSFKRFYQHRMNIGLNAEKRRSSVKTARVEEPNISDAEMKDVIKTGPFLRFERQGLLELNEDGTSFVINSALLPGLTPTFKSSLKAMAITRIAEHFAEPILQTESIVAATIG